MKYLLPLALASLLCGPFARAENAPAPQDASAQKPHAKAKKRKTASEEVKPLTEKEKALAAQGQAIIKKAEAEGGKPIPPELLDKMNSSVPQTGK